MGGSAQEPVRVCVEQKTATQRQSMGPTANEELAQETQSRIRLFVTVLLAVDLLSHVTDIVNPLVFDYTPVPLTGTAVWLRYGVGAFNLMMWGLLWFRRLSLAVSIALEVLFTLAMVTTYTLIALSYVPIAVLAPTFALLGVNMLLVVRSSLVPSTALRTAVVGLAAQLILFLFFAERFRELDPLVFDGLLFMALTMVIVTTVASRVIYGLRKQVRDMTRLGAYALERKLGEGGMGVVYEARHGMLRRPTAVKLLPPERAGLEGIERFEQEVRLTAQLTHPNTVTVFDYGRTPDGVFYYAMELLDGATLEQVVALTGAQEDARILSVIRASAAALDEAHTIGLIHRDVKPSNIMLCRQGRRNDVVKLLDFGLVKQLDRGEDGATTANQTLIGTPMYMAPEAIREGEAVDARSDVYALGAVAYFLATGSHLFSGGSIVEICAKHLHQEPESPSARLGRAVDQELEAVILRCLRKQPEERPQSAAELIDELDRVKPGTRFFPDEWWDEYEPALNDLRAEGRESVSGETLVFGARY
ncbi:MAG: serine/threonine-protein kinase [Myxococcota bacterium]